MPPSGGWEMTVLQIPDHLAPLVRELVAEHWRFQLHQVRLFQCDHPQRTKAFVHLDRARELAEVVGIETRAVA